MAIKTEIKSHKAKRFKALASVSGRIERMVELTGTPSPNGLDDLCEGAGQFPLHSLDWPGFF